MPTPLPSMTPLRLLRALIRVPPRSVPGGTDHSAMYHLQQIDHDHLQRYCRLLGFAADNVPLSYLALLAQRAQFDLMLSQAFPYRIAGVIHTGQTAEAVAALNPRRPLAFICRLQQPEQHDSGRIDVRFSITVQQAEQPVGLITSTLTVRRGRRGTHSSHRNRVANDLLPFATWPTGLHLSRAYARLSGDWNPIHLSGLTARLFGLQRPIVHGMETLARSTAALEQRLTRPVIRLQARFRRPITAGSSVNLAYRAADGAFEITAADQVCVEGLAAVV